MRRWLLLLVLVIAAPDLGAQVVRGRVTERASQAPLAGVLVELLSATGDSVGARVAAGLSAPDGTYALRAPASGRYVVTAKRIGVQRFRSAPIDLANGETAVRDLALEPVLYVLPEVVVTGLSSCDAGRGDGARVAALWEEARTALFATQLSLRDELFTAHVTRYVRELDPRSRRVLSETRSEVAGRVSRPFSAIDGDSLSTHGYWFPRADGGYTYFGPDADVLLADAFLRDHCFREVKGRRDRRGVVGLGFRPLPSRAVPDVVGVLWLDERTFELRFVEFNYSKVHSSADSASIGGEVHFARLRSGAWIIRRWFIRLPVVARPSAPVSTGVTAAPWVLVRPTTLMFREEGGEVAAEELLGGAAQSSMRGLVRDSANRPMGGATVRLSGTRLAARTSENGTFTIDSVPYGRHTLVLESPGYDSLGLAAADLTLEVSEESNPRPTIRALNGRQLYTRLCLGRAPQRGFGALRIAVRSPSGDSVVSRLPVAVSWRLVQRWTQQRDSSFKMVELSTDDRGQVTICEVPSGREITIVVALPAGGALPTRTLVLPDRGVKGEVVRLPGR